jgi:glycosyltransferase involved in cell wall biosynthesis
MLIGGIKTMSKQSKKKILVLNYEFPPLGGGASPVSSEIVKGLSKRGYDIDVITMSYKNLPRHQIIEGANIYRVRSLRRKKDRSNPIEQLVYILNAFLLFLFKMDKKYDFIHCHFIIPTGVLAYLISSIWNIPYIITSHGSDVLGYNTQRFYKYLYPLLKLPWRKIVNESSLIITPSNYLKEKILEVSGNARIQVIPNGIKKDKFVELEKKNEILLVSRLVESKGVQYVIKAIAEEFLLEYLRKNNWIVKALRIYTNCSMGFDLSFFLLRDLTL